MYRGLQNLRTMQSKKLKPSSIDNYYVEPEDYYKPLDMPNKEHFKHFGFRGVLLGAKILAISSTKRVHLGLSKVAFIEGCPRVRGGLYRGVSSHQGWPLRRVPL